MSGDIISLPCDCTKYGEVAHYIICEWVNGQGKTVADVSCTKCRYDTEEVIINE